MLKIKKLFNKNYLTYILIIFVFILIALPIGLLVYQSVNNKRDFILANYQSYMAEDVQKKLKNKYGLSYDYIEVAEDSRNLLIKDTADIANTTTYEISKLVEDDLIQEIDWTRFNLPGISTADDALTLFTPITQKILKSYDLNNNGLSGDKEDNLLRYGFPYFLQDLIFAYRGSEIKTINNNSDWSSLFSLLITDKRFKATHLPNLIALNDPRTIYSIAKSIQTKNTTINPDKNESIQSLEETFKYLADLINQISQNPISFNSDSSVVLNKIALGEVNGAFCFNGDALFASYGGDEEADINLDDFHVVKPSNNLVSLDMFVLNKKMDGNKLERAYGVIKDLCLEVPTNPDEITKSMIYQNFNFVNYTSPINELNNYILDYYFDENDPRKDIYQIDDNAVENRIEYPIDNITKSNFKFAWIYFQSLIK